MSRKIYKYAGPDVFEKHFAAAGYCSLKCSYPGDFNDPYELFLTINYEQPPEVLAYYQETIGEIPQRPTTCFSKSPEVIPMWAHYAHGHRGVAIEIDEDRLAEHFTEISFGDINYQYGPDEEIEHQLHRALMTRKPRHIYFLQTAVMSAAYFTKSSCWGYEQERRLVARDADIEEMDGLQLLYVPYDCVSALIIGSRTPEAIRSAVRYRADEIDCPYYEMHISRSTTKPYFADLNGDRYLFVKNEFVNAENCCINCAEPIDEESKECAWCAVRPAHREAAAENNPMRILQHTGMLQEYYQQCEQIRRSGGGE